MTSVLTLCDTYSVLPFYSLFPKGVFLTNTSYGKCWTLLLFPFIIPCICYLFSTFVCFTMEQKFILSEKVCGSRIPVDMSFQRAVNVFFIANLWIYKYNFMHKNWRLLEKFGKNSIPWSVKSIGDSSHYSPAWSIGFTFYCSSAPVLFWTKIANYDKLPYIVGFLTQTTVNTI